VGDPMNGFIGTLIGVCVLIILVIVVLQLI
jgi:hypothetical protein